MDTSWRASKGCCHSFYPTATDPSLRPVRSHEKAQATIASPHSPRLVQMESKGSDKLYSSMVHAPVRLAVFGCALCQEDTEQSRPAGSKYHALVTPACSHTLQLHISASNTPAGAWCQV